MIKTCKQCGKSFNSNNLHKIYCCDECSKKAKKENDKKNFYNYLKNPDNHEKHLIRMRTNSMVRAGKIQRGNCCVCGCPATELHHAVYAAGYETAVIPVCKQHHEAIHSR